MSALPPIEPLREVARRLEAAEITFALGGSGLMHALGLADAVRDWDVTTDAPRAAVRDALADLDPVLHGNSGIHADHKVTAFAGGIEVICQFAFFGPGGVIRIPTIVTGAWQGIPLGSPLAWAVAYALMIGEKPGRAEKAETLFAYAREHPDSRALAALATAPLPEGLRRRLPGDA